MKALFVTNMWPDERRPWYGTFVESQAESLREAGVEVDVLSIAGYANRGAYAGAAGRMLAANGRRRWDVVHAHYGHSGVVARLGVRAPLVVSYCGDDLLGTRSPDGGLTPRSRIEAAVFRRLAHVASATITKSRQMHEALPPSCRERNHVIPNGVDLGRFRRMARDEARRVLGWDQDEPVALFAGNPDVASKNFPLAHAAYQLAAAELPGLRLRVAWGHPPAEMPVLMSAADALIFTSLSEGSPNVIKEALACELPVVAARVGDVEERLAGLPACHAGEHDPGELARALVAAVGHGRVPEARAAIEPLSAAAVADRIVMVYRRVLSHGPSYAPLIGGAS